MAGVTLDKVDAVVLAGGLGTRLRSVVGGAQKTMAEVNGRPFLDIILDHLYHSGFRRLVLCTGYQAATLEAHYRRDGRGLAITFSRETEPLGTGGAIKLARAQICSNPFLVLNGDSFCAVDYPALLAAHQARSDVATLVVAPVADRADYGTVELDDDRRVMGFHEKQAAGAPSASPYVSAGVYCLDQSIFSRLPAGERFSLERDVFPALAGQGAGGFVTTERFWDIGTPERYAAARQHFGRPAGPGIAEGRGIL